MADNSMFDTPDSPPPPAYEFSQQEFDQKVSHALEESRSLPPPQPRPSDDDEWEVWDEAAFNAAVARLGLSEGSSSSAVASPAAQVAPHQPAAPRKFMQDAIDSKVPPPSDIQPLRISKKEKGRSPSPKREKERPSWYAEAQLGEHAPSAQSSTQAAAPSRVQHPPNTHIPAQPVYQEREPTPPPVFEAIGPSLDGPPYEGPPAGQVVLSYNPPSPGSRPESPLQSPTSPPARYEYRLPPPPTSPPPPIPSQQEYQHPQHQRTLPVPEPPRQAPSPIPTPPPPRNAHQSMPAPSKPAHKMGPRPVTTYNPTGRASHLAFNPQVAYNRKSHTQYTEEDQLPTKVDASAFYNSSVASLAATRRVQPPSQPNRASYNPAAATPNPPLPPKQPVVQRQQTQQPQQLAQPAGGYPYSNHNYAGGYPAAPVPMQQQYNPYQQQPVQQYPQQQVTAAPGVVVTQTWAPNPYMGQQYGRGW